MMDPHIREYLTINQVAELLQTTPQQITYLIRIGKLRSFRIGDKPGSAIRITAESLERLVSEAGNDGH